MKNRTTRIGMTALAILLCSRSHSKCSSIFCRSRRCTCRRTELTDLYSNQRRNPVEISWQQHRPCWRSGFADRLDWKRIWWHNMENSLRKVRCQTRCILLLLTVLHQPFYFSSTSTELQLISRHISSVQPSTSAIWNNWHLSPEHYFTMMQLPYISWTSGKIGRYANKYSEQ